MKESFFKLRKKVRKGLRDELDSGFSFVETLAVLAVTAILSSSIGVAAHKVLLQAKCVAAKNQIEQFSIALHSYYADCGRFPTEEQGLDALWKKPVLYPVPENWDGPYLQHFSERDPWGNVYAYRDGKSSRSLEIDGVPEGIPFSIISYGADGLEGGKGAEKDIYSWE